jgi:hypothetical protein
MASYCRECDGGALCPHSTQKHQCRLCFTHPESFCKLCTYTYVFPGKSYHPYCAPCYYHLHPEAAAATRYMAKENYYHDFLVKNLPDYQLVHNRTVDDSRTGTSTA